MRLVNARTLSLETFDDDSQRPRYAILSHRWLHGREILFHDFLNHCKDEDDEIELEGWSKIKNCCTRALVDHLEYIWVDTCCINKESSAELSEAINSMFRWYRDADRCYAYLHDVSTDHGTPWKLQFTSSEWFLRAWTLQELIAPTWLHFFDREWNPLGSRSSLAKEVSLAAGIHRSVFVNPDLDLGAWSMAQRMSWASHRIATRVEDIAYSLLGIFDVNMPLLYGEGQKAFLRLQEEIIRRTHDHSIFAWSGSSDPGSSSDSEPKCELTGMLANSPAQFLYDGDVERLESDTPVAYSLTNLGLQIHLQTKPWGTSLHLAALNCFRHSIDPVGVDHGVDQIGIFILMKTWGQVGAFRVILNGRSCARWDWARTVPSASRSHGSHKRLRTFADQLQLVTVGTQIRAPDEAYLERAFHRSNIRVTVKLKSLMEYREPEAVPVCQSLMKLPNSYPRTECLSLFATARTSAIHPGRHDWNIINFVNADVSRYGILCIIMYPLGSNHINAIKLGIDIHSHPVCILADGSNVETAETTPKLDRSGLPVNYLPIEQVHKDFWEWDCLEEENWSHCNNPSPQVLEGHPPYLGLGLWTMKGRYGQSSTFRLFLGEGDERHSIVIKFGCESENSWTFSIVWS